MKFKCNTAVVTGRLSFVCVVMVKPAWNAKRDKVQRGLFVIGEWLKCRSSWDMPTWNFNSAADLPWSVRMACARWLHGNSRFDSKSRWTRICCLDRRLSRGHNYKELISLPVSFLGSWCQLKHFFVNSFSTLEHLINSDFSPTPGSSMTMNISAAICHANWNFDARSAVYSSNSSIAR